MILPNLAFARSVNYYCTVCCKLKDTVVIVNYGCKIEQVTWAQCYKTLFVRSLRIIVRSLSVC